jgi:NADH-quinone oxidoreductase subunit G
VHVDQRAGQVYRLLPRENEAVNKSWMCDEGRLTYNRANKGRLTDALLLSDSGVVPATGADALARAVALLAPAAKSKGGLAVGISMHATNETAYVLALLLQKMFGIQDVVLLGYADGEADTLLRMADKNPNRAGITQVMQSMGIRTIEASQFQSQLKAGLRRGLLCVGGEMDAALAQDLADAAKRMDVCVHIAFAHNPLTQAAHVTLPGTAWVEEEGTWISGEQRLQRLAPAFAPGPAARQTLGWLLDLARGLGAPIEYASMQTLQAAMQTSLSQSAPIWREVSVTNVGPQGSSLVPTDAAGAA